jgi:hypothetical protein
VGTPANQRKMLAQEIAKSNMKNSQFKRMSIRVFSIFLAQQIFCISRLYARYGFAGAEHPARQAGTRFGSNLTLPA